MNSPDETKTQPEKEFAIGFAKQIGDIGALVTRILVAVFFTILILTGNTMAQSIRERIPELGDLEDARLLGRQGHRAGARGGGAAPGPGRRASAWAPRSRPCPR